MRPNEDRWARQLTRFVDAHEGIGGSDVHCVHRSADGTQLRFTPSKLITGMDESVFAEARRTLGPAVDVSQGYDRATRSQRLYFDVRAPTEVQAKELGRRYASEQALLRTATWPLTLLAFFALLAFVNILYVLHALHEHWEPHEDATITLRSHVWYHVRFYFSKVFG